MNETIAGIQAELQILQQHITEENRALTGQFRADMQLVFSRITADLDRIKHDTREQEAALQVVKKNSNRRILNAIYLKPE